MLQQEGLAAELAHARQRGRMKAVLLPEPSGSSRAPACCCLPVQAPCQTLAGSAHAAPPVSPETALLTTAHELLTHRSIPS